MIVPVAGTGSISTRSGSGESSSDEASSLPGADPAGVGSVVGGNDFASGGGGDGGGGGGGGGPADDDAFDVAAGHLYFHNSHAGVFQLSIMGAFSTFRKSIFRWICSSVM